MVGVPCGSGNWSRLGLCRSQGVVVQDAASWAQSQSTVRSLHNLCMPIQTSCLESGLGKWHRFRTLGDRDQHSIILQLSQPPVHHHRHTPTHMRSRGSRTWYCTSECPNKRFGHTQQVVRRRAQDPVIPLVPLIAWLLGSQTDRPCLSFQGIVSKLSSLRPTATSMTTGSTRPLEKTTCCTTMRHPQPPYTGLHQENW